MVERRRGEGRRINRKEHDSMDVGKHNERDYSVLIIIIIPFSTSSPLPARSVSIMMELE